MPTPSLLDQPVDIEILAHPVSESDLSGLCILLRESVHAGASIGFLDPLSESDALVYWRKVALDLDGGHRLILVARDAGRIVGTAQLALESRANGRHRAEVQKVMVSTSVRRRGIASLLVSDLERRARERGVRLLVLDTSEGPGGARAFYDALGYSYVGGIPGYALDPDGAPARNAIYFKELA